MISWGLKKVHAKTDDFLIFLNFSGRKSDDFLSFLVHTKLELLVYKTDRDFLSF